MLIKEYTLSNEQRLLIRSLFRKLPPLDTTNLAANEEGLRNIAGIAALAIPKDLQEQIRDMVHKKGPPIFRIRNLPMGKELDDTPDTYLDKPKYLNDYFALSILSMLIESEKGSARKSQIQNINVLNSMGRLPFVNRKKLPLHTDSDGMAAFWMIQNDVTSSAGLQAKNIFQSQKDPHEQIEIALQDNDLVIFDESRVLHGRSRYKTNPNGKGRWLRKLDVQRRETPGENETPEL